MQFEVMLASCIIICDKLRYDLTNRENEKLSQYPEICSKLAELTPLNVKGVRVIISSKRIAMDTSEVEEIITVIRQHVL